MSKAGRIYRAIIGQLVNGRRINIDKQLLFIRFVVCDGYERHPILKFVFNASVETGVFRRPLVVKCKVTRESEVIAVWIEVTEEIGSRRHTRAQTDCRAVTGTERRIDKPVSATV